MKQILLDALDFQLDKRYKTAKEIYKSELTQDLTNEEKEFACVNLANVCFFEKNYEEAEKYYLDGLNTNSHNQKTLYNLGVLYLKQERYEDAKVFLEKSHQINQKHFSTKLNLGICYKNIKDYDNAFLMLQKCLEDKKDDPDVYYNLGNIYMAIEKHNWAIKNYLKVLKLKDEYPKAYYSLGLSYHKMGRHKRAIRCLDTAIKQKQNYNDALFAKGLCLLQMGEFASGWELYHYRWEAKNELKIPLYTVTFYNGESLKDKVILVQGEQGFGDTIQFCRYLHYLKDAKKIYFAVRDELKDLMKNSFNFVEVCGNNDTLLGVDYFVSLLDLPRIFNQRNIFMDIGVPYLKISSKVDLELDKNFLNIGFVWQGNPEHKNDHNRSIDLKYFETIFGIENCRFYSLQKGSNLECYANYENIFDISNRFYDFNTSAALIEKLDLIISIDSAPIHLAGAISQKAILLLPKQGEWRWLEKIDNSPYYPSVKILRQQKQKEWTDVFEELKNILQRELMKKNILDNNGFNGLKHSKYGYCLYNKNDMYVGKSIDIYGEYCEGEAEIFEQICKSGDVIIEVGANIGTHTVMLAKSVGASGKVYAFEPQRIVFQTLCANIALNSLTNVFTYQVAVGDEAGQILVPAIDYSQINNFGGVELGKGNIGEVVKLVRLDNFLKLDRLKLIKIDVEGMEIEAIRGAMNLIKEFIPILYVENDRREKSKQLIELLWSLDYDLYWHLPKLFNINNFFGVRENKIGNYVSANMLCIPKPQKLNITGFEKIQDSSAHPLVKR